MLKQACNKGRFPCLCRNGLIGGKSFGELEKYVAAQSSLDGVAYSVRKAPRIERMTICTTGNAPPHSHSRVLWAVGKEVLSLGLQQYSIMLLHGGF